MRYIWCKFTAEWMTSTLHSSLMYSEILDHATSDIMTKLTEYPSSAKQEAKLEAQRSNAEARMLKNIAITID